MSEYKLYNLDCRQGLKQLADNSIDMIITDPPYFTDGLGSNWDDNKLEKKRSRAKVIQGLPVGMKFDPNQGKKLQEFMTPIAKEFFRVLKPGGFCVVFSQGRLYHRMAMAFDEACFEIRDLMGWKYEGQAKAFSQDYLIRKNKNFSDEEKQELIKALTGWKTPQLKPQLEPMVLAQKPKDGTFVENWKKYGVGLMNTHESLDNMFPGNIMEVSKHERTKETSFKIGHLTVKPVKLISHLIKLFTQKGQIVLDPFAGSGSHGIASIMNDRRFIGFEIEPKYCSIAMERLAEFTENIPQKVN